MASTESLIFDLLVRDRASDGLSKIGGSAGSAAGSVDSLIGSLNDVGRKSVTARLALAGDKEAQASLDKIDARLIGLDRRTASPNITVEGAARATAEVSALDLELDKLGKKGGSADTATSALGEGGLAGPVGMIALIGAGVALSPVIATVSVGLGGLALAAYKTISPILAAGTATAAAQQALAGLDPAQRAAYTSLGALKTQFGGFAKALEPEAIGIFNQGLKLAGGLLGDAEPVAAATGKALGTVVAEIGADLKTQQWQAFFAFMARTAGPDIQQLGNLFTDLMNTLPPLLEELQPVANALISVADNSVKAVGALNAMMPAVSGSALSADKAAQSNTGLWGSLVKLLDNSKLYSSEALGVSQSTDKASSSMDKAKASAQAAAPQVGTLSGDMGVLASNTVTSTDATKAWNDMWSIFVGKSVSDQQAVLNTAAAFDAYNTSLKTNKQDSTVAQQSFLSIITTMGTGLSTLQANGASVRDLNSFYADNISKLKALHGLTPAERADVQGITRDYDVWANSTAGLSKQTVTAAGALKTQFLSQIGAIEAHAPGVSADVTNLATSILKTGNNSASTRADRAQLIADLEKAGATADGARSLVNKLQGQIDAMHGKSVAVGAVAHGSGQITATENILGEKSQRLGNLTFVAAGRYVTGGTPGRDSVLLAAMPGELVVPVPLVQAGAVDHLRGRIPGFAAGGVVGQGIPDWMGGMGSTFVKGAANSGAGALMSAFLSAANSAAMAALAATGSGGAGVARWAPDILTVLAMLRQDSSNLGAVEHRMNQESGGNPRAINLTDSNAQHGDPSRGLMQTIMGTFQRFRSFALPNDIYNPLANIFAGLNYAIQDYPGRSLASVMLQAGGYDKGGYLPTGLSLAYNGTGAPEPVIPAGRGGGAAAGSTVTIIVKVDPVIAAVTPDRNLGRHIADHVTAFIKGGGKLYPAGTKPS